MRPLGIPTVLDRFIQQAVLQVLQAAWGGTVSETSFGFRPGRSAHQAVEQAQAYIASGHGLKFLAKRLKLKVKQGQEYGRQTELRKFLRFSVTGGRQPRRRIAPQARRRCTELRESSYA